MVTNAYLTSFNSTLVQLKEQSFDWYLGKYEGFNSTLVQLKAMPSVW